MSYLKTIVFTSAAILFLLIFTLSKSNNYFKPTLHQDINIEKYKKIDEEPTDLTSRKWLNYGMKIAKHENMAPTIAARFYAYITSVYADTLEVTNSDYLASSNTRDLINILKPNYQEYTNTVFSDSQFATESTSEVAQNILEKYVDRIKDDNFRLKWVPKPETTSPNDTFWFIRNNAIDGGAMAGEWLTWLIDPHMDFSIPPPPQRGSIRDQLEIEKIIVATRIRTTSDLDKIYFWQGASGFIKGQANDNISPAGVWQNILYKEEGGKKNNFAYAKLQKILAQSIADSFIYCWKIKYEYMSQRPSMRVKDLDLALADPPFPSYVSGHSSVSETAKVVLTYLLPDKKQIWKENSEDARITRLLAGIHFDSDNEQGNQLGQAVGLAIVDKLSQQDKTHFIYKKRVFLQQNLLEQLGTLYLLKAQVFYQNFLIGLDSYSKMVRRSFFGSFQDVTKSSGLVDNKTAWGVSWYDFNNDGFLDILITGFKSGNKLYKNNGDGTFTDATKKSMLTQKRARVGVFGDYNNDGCADIYLSLGNVDFDISGMPIVAGESDILEKNNCNGTFTDVTKQAGIYDGYHGTGVAWADYDNDGYLDLYVTNYGIHESDYQKYEPNILYHNNGDGTFTDVTEKTHVSGNQNCFTNYFHFPSDISFTKQSYQPLWFDYNNDNKIDLYITNDRGINVLYKNNGDGTFTDVTKSAGLCLRGTGMGVTVGDYNNDGYEDLYITNIGVNYFWQNKKNGTFTEINNIMNISQYEIGWGTNFFDYDNDGYLDLFIANGVVDGNNKILLTNDKLLHNNRDNTFMDVSESEGIYGEGAQASSAVGDYNNDGTVDLIEIIRNTKLKGNTHLYKNINNKNNWLTIQLVGTKSNRDSVGAKIIVVTKDHTQYKQIIYGSSFLSQDSPWPTFGLGNNPVVKSINILWPSGIKKVLTNVDVNRKIIIKE